MAVEKVGGGRTHWTTAHVARSAGHHLVSYRLGQVGGALPWPNKYHILERFHLQSSLS
jgi:hypothetical protein